MNGKQHKSANFSHQHHFFLAVLFEKEVQIMHASSQSHEQHRNDPENKFNRYM
jgi:hypothetical protein